MPHTEESHYIRHVTDLGNQQKIIAEEDVYLENGHKLIARGNPVDSQIHERILKHKLAKPIEQSVSLENMLSGDTLNEEISRKLRHSQLAGKMKRDYPELEKVASRLLSNLNLPAQLLFKLTILKEKLPDIFSHSIDVSITALYTGLNLDLPQSDLRHLLIAGLLHDIGMLHLDPAIFNRQRNITEEERKSIYAHPVIGYMILKPFRDMNTPAHAILEHHERLDGSGYPKSLTGDQLDTPGKILAIAELAISLQDQPLALPYEHRLAAILKFNQPRYDSDGSRVLLDLVHRYYDEPQTPPVNLPRDEFTHCVSSVWNILDDWEQSKSRSSHLPDDIKDYIDTQTTDIKAGLIRSGLARESLEVDEAFLDAMLEKPCEIMAILNEAMYQLKNTIRELERRWPDISLDRKLTTTVNDWIAMAQNMMGSPDEDEGVPDFTDDGVP